MAWRHHTLSDSKQASGFYRLLFSLFGRPSNQSDCAWFITFIRKGQHQQFSSSSFFGYVRLAFVIYLQYERARAHTMRTVDCSIARNFQEKQKTKLGNGDGGNISSRSEEQQKNTNQNKMMSFVFFFLSFYSSKRQRLHLLDVVVC